MNQSKFQPKMISRSIASCISSVHLIASVGGIKDKDQLIDKKNLEKTLKTA